MTLLTDWEAAARLFEKPTAKWPTPGAMAVELDNRTVQTSALDLIDAALVALVAEPDSRLIISMPPQEGKSQRISRRFPLWVLQRNPSTRVAIASYEANVARRWGRAIRDDVGAHGDTLGGMAVRSDLSAQHEWQLLGHDGGVFSVGIGGGLTGRPVDLLIIDDPIKDRVQADSVAYRDKVWDWWTDVASTRLAPGAPVVLVLTRWHEDDLAARLLAHEDGHLWTVINVPAQSEEAETDTLGRTVGQFMLSARGRTRAQWEAIKVRVGSRTWASLYQGHPSPTEGGILKRAWWRYYEQQPWLERDDGACIVTHCDEIMASWDLTFKDTDGSDYVVGQIWMRRAGDAYLLDQVRRQMDFVETCRAFEAMAAKWPQATLKLVEDKANGPAVIAALRRTVPGIVPEEPQGSKPARAAAIAPLVEAGNVYLPKPSMAPWVGGFIEEAASFPNGANDDQVDALTQGLNRLVLQPLLAGGMILDQDDIDADLADYAISPY